MSDIFDRFFKKLGIDIYGSYSQSQIDLPPEFQLSNENGNDNTHNFIHTNNLSQDLNDMFDENMSMFFANLEKLFHFDQMGLEFPSSIEDDSNIFNDGNFDEPLVGEEYNKIPKKNFVARDYFLNSRLTSRKTLSDSPVRVEISPKFNSQTSSSKSYYFGQLNGKRIEKEVSTKQLPNGITQKITVMKDGDQKCITTVDMLSGHQLNSEKKLYNLDESQLDEFEKRFSKFG